MIFEKPSVIVLMPVYNHARFVADAIEGVLRQVTDFDVHLCVCDDASSDDSFQIASTYGNQNRVILDVRRNETNLGATGNGAKLREIGRVSGCKYITICEGDDYWTDPEKLQKQVDFLERSPHHSGCCHNLQIRPDNSDLPPTQFYSGLKHEFDFTIETLIDSSILCPIGTASMIYRAALFYAIVDNDLKNLAFADRPLLCLVSKFGPIKYFPEVMGVYRKHSGGFTHKFNWSLFERDYENFFVYINRKLDYKYDSLIKKQLKGVYLSSSHQYFGQRRFDAFRSTFNKIQPLLLVHDYFTPSVLKMYAKFIIQFFLGRK